MPSTRDLLVLLMGALKAKAVLVAEGAMGPAYELLGPILLKSSR